MSRTLPKKRRCPFYDVVSLPLGGAFVVYQAETTDTLGKLDPRHRRLILRYDGYDRVLSGPGDLVDLAAYMGWDIEAMVRAQPEDFALLFTSTTCGGFVVLEWWLRRLRSRGAAIDDLTYARIENDHLHYHVAVKTGRLEFSIFKVSVHVSHLVTTMVHVCDDSLATDAPN